ncbi:MAG: class I SAM-dependent methyltransferase family protein, partial [Halobacteriales archaeon]|nr:class I SAM-dependent methyltransferase family protein [Halobacteriales archaeon]
AGEGRTETVHNEHGVAYALDLAKVMFSPGNQAERVRMGRVVSPGERVFDMFAGIGYFALPMAVAGARVTAAEINPTAFTYLLENRERNDVVDRISASLTDCRTLRPTVDRVVMGHYDAPDYLDAAVRALRPGGVLHCHAAVRLDHRDAPLDRLEQVTETTGRSLESTTIRTVKTTGQRWEHVVLDATVG